MPFKKPHHTPEPDNIIKLESGGYLIKPRGLKIVWGNDPRYWKVQDNVAELIQVSWLEVSGSVPVTKGQKYKVRFRVKVKEDGFGWNNTKVLVMAKVGKKGSYFFKEATLKPDGKELIIPYGNNDLEIEVDANATDAELHFGLYEVWSGKWKGGLEIIRAEVIAV